MTAHNDSDDGAPPSLPAGAERRYGFRAIGVAASQVAAPLLKRRGGLLVRLKLDWAHIVGEAWAEVSWPAALGRDGALKLRVLPTAALDLQHRVPLLIERINLYFGRPVATRLVFVQGPLPLAPAPAPESPAPPAGDTVQAFDERLAQIPDPDLRAALARLGRAVGAAAAEPPRGRVAPKPGTQ
ncbi:MAG TPA: DciA family protein [Stellaceae bacterium]|nr:DciA family protein [Stellaceae bacterium]